jgi:hypothetical protein
VVVGPDQNQGVARAAQQLMEPAADIEKRTLPQAAVERRIPERHHEVFQAGDVRGYVGTASHIGELQRDEAVIDKIMQPQRTTIGPVQGGIRDAVADAEGPAIGLDHGPVAGVIDAKPHP